jgi:hypothetical protein
VPSDSLEAREVAMMYSNMDSIFREEITWRSTKATMLRARQKAFHKHHLQAPRYLAWFSIFLITWRVSAG